MSNSDEVILFNIYTQSFSAQNLLSLGTKYNRMPFDAFLSHKQIIQPLIENLRNDIYSYSALVELKQELIPYKILYTIHHRRQKSRGKNKKKKISAELREISIENILKWIVKAELAQYNRYFEEHTFISRVGMKKLTKTKKLCRRLREETLLEIYKSIYTANTIRLQIEKSLLENPRELYPAARAMNRKFIIHSGTTNTGKTYNAIKALKAADTGAYLGPLRLLAMEIQENLLFDEVMCNLKTGEEEDIVPYATHVSSTVEMADLYTVYDTVVIDECQMIGDKHRGCAWTRAILGISAYEIHLCTAPEAVNILVKIINDCGDTYEIVNYKRRTPLIYDNSLDTGKAINRTNEDGTRRKIGCKERLDKINLDALEYGDALIAFSRKDVLEISEMLYKRGISASVIYGSMPYNTRKMQLKRFINRETQVIVATDAIGMGLNLPIRRIIFTAAHKFDGEKFRRLYSEEIKQIAGRAGRKGMYDKGYVFTVEEKEHINFSLISIVDPIEKAYIDFDTSFLDIESEMEDILKAWSQANMPFDFYEKIDVKRIIILLKHLNELCTRKHLQCDKETKYCLATITFDESDGGVFGCWIDYVKEYLSGKAGALSLPKIQNSSIEKLESSFKKVDLYYSFCRAMGYFPNLDWIKDTKKYIAEEINYRLIGKREGIKDLV